MLEFRSAQLSGQLRIAAKGSPRQGSSLLIGIIRSQSKPFRMIFLHIYDNKSFVVIFLRKNRGRRVKYLTHNFDFWSGMNTHLKLERKLHRMSSYEFAELKVSLE